MDGKISPTALIVGASGTIGGAIASELLARKFSLGLHYHTQKQRCDAGVAQAVSAGIMAKAYAADFTNPTAAGDLAAAFLKDFQRIDALIWSAGIARDALVANGSEEDVRLVLNVNLKSFFLALKAFSRQWMKQRSGSVIAISSHAAISGRVGGAAYAMAHAGLLSLIKSGAREWGALGVRVNAVLPPYIAESAIGRSASPEFAAAAKARAVLKKDFDAASAVAMFVANLVANPSASGQVFSVDSRIVAGY